MRTLAKIHSAFSHNKEEDEPQGDHRPVGDDDGVSTGSLNVLLSALIILLLSFSLVLMLTFSMVASAYGAGTDGNGRSLHTVLRQAILAMDDGNYQQALSGLLEVHAQDPENRSVAYQIGRCLLYGLNQPELAADYLRKAAKGTTDVYDRWDLEQRTAPHTALYDMGKALETTGWYAEAKGWYILYMGTIKPGRGVEPRRQYTAVVMGIRACERVLEPSEESSAARTAMEE